jgi:hypothetical protein
MRGHTLVLLLAATLPCAAKLDISCQIFDETMVCDNEKDRYATTSTTRTCAHSPFMPRDCMQRPPPHPMPALFAPTLPSRLETVRARRLVRAEIRTCAG